ncbi:hypothetical protein PTQ21_12360 [Paenibacillus marchantiae]|uniref:hypothetical protein n=1 Tax=Paenibacillus marchantiae TaxID=3026433 RepID=UPI00237BBC32|nr:hypothetical protein [Paenibacillus marchantiae]WDQ34980.1 hypothetical protein PTQ21_12360 [Paenibacillus marchantiae]
MDKRFELEKKLMEELIETRELYETTMTECDILMNFVMHNDLTKALDSYIYGQLKNCNDEYIIDRYLQLVTNPQEEFVNEETSVESSETQPFFFINGQAVDFSKILVGNSK